MQHQQLPIIRAFYCQLFVDILTFLPEPSLRTVFNYKLASCLTYSIFTLVLCQKCTLKQEDGNMYTDTCINITDVKIIEEIWNKKSSRNMICKQVVNPPGLLHSYIAVEFFQSVLACVMVHNKDALFHVWPLGSLEDCYWST